MREKLLLLIIVLLLWGYHEYINVKRLEVEDGQLDVRRAELMMKFAERYGNKPEAAPERL